MTRVDELLRDDASIDFGTFAHAVVQAAILIAAGWRIPARHDHDAEDAAAADAAAKVTHAIACGRRTMEGDS